MVRGQIDSELWGFKHAQIARFRCISRYQVSGKVDSEVSFRISLYGYIGHVMGHPGPKYYGPRAIRQGVMGVQACRNAPFSLYFNVTGKTAHLASEESRLTRPRL